MSYADDPVRLARLLRDLADALYQAGVDPSGSSNERHLADDARRAACELDPGDAPRKPGKFVGF